MTVLEAINKREDAICGKGADEDQIVAAERRLDLCFSADYREYLSSVGLVMYDGHELTGLGGDDRTDVIKVTSESRQVFEDVPADWYVIEQIGVEDLTIWQSSSGKIYQIAENKKKQQICKSLIEYILEDADAIS